MDLKALLQAQIDRPGVGNASGFPSWRIDGDGVANPRLEPTEAKCNRRAKGYEDEYPSRVNPRYELPSWTQIVQAVQKRYDVTWESPTRKGVK
jgi:hypothetical protein